MISVASYSPFYRDIAHMNARRIHCQMMSLPVGRPERRVRSRGLPRKRGLDRQWGSITVTIGRLLVARGAGEWPATACSPALDGCVSFAPRYGASAPASPWSAQHTSARSPPRCAADGSRALSVSTSSVRRGQDRFRRVRVSGKGTNTLSKKIDPLVSVHIGVNAQCG